MFMKKMMAVLTAQAFMLNMAEAAGGAAEDKKPQFCKKDFDLETGEVFFAFGDGETISANVYEYQDKIQKRLMLHGAIQKGGDSYAGAKGNYSEAKASLREVLDNLKAGEWRGSREDGQPRIGDLAEAIARVKGIKLATATTAVEAASEDKRKEWRAHPRIKAAIAQIKAEKAQKELEAASAAGDIEL